MIKVNYLRELTPQPARESVHHINHRSVLSSPEYGNEMQLLEKYSSRPADLSLCHTQVTNNRPVCTIYVSYILPTPPLNSVLHIGTLNSLFILSIFFQPYAFVYILNKITIFMFNIQTIFNFKLAVEEPIVDMFSLP